MNPAELLAHQGGWDELLLVAAPLGIIAGLLVFANRRVTAKLNEAVEQEESAAAGPPAAAPDNPNPDSIGHHDA